MKFIAYASDLSDLEVTTLRYAYKLADGLNCKLIVLHVYSVPPVTVSTIRAPSQIKQRLQAEKVDLVMNYCTKYLNDDWVRTNVEIKVQEHTSISEGVLLQVSKINPDLLVVGMKDEHTQRGLFSGSIAKALIANVLCPLIVIPNTKRFRKIKTIVYATDFEKEDIFAIKKLVAIAKPFSAKIRVVHIPTVEEFVSQEQLEWFKKMVGQKVNYPNVQFHTFLADTIYNGLRVFIDSHKADVLVMLERENKDSFFKKLFHKDLVKKMESHVSIPLLSINKRIV